MAQKQPRGLPVIYCFIGNRDGEISSRFEFLDWHVVSVFPNDCICNFPNLDQIVFGGTAKHPWIVEIPAKVRYSICVAPVHEQPVIKEKNRVSSGLRRNGRKSGCDRKLTILEVRLQRLQAFAPRLSAPDPKI